MRIISQNGNADIPYEKARIIHANNEVIASVGAYDYTMGVYSSNEKAYKAMEMVRQAYTGVTIFQNVEPTEDVLEILKNMSMQPMLITNTMNQHTERIDNYSNVVFQFPKDDEIEV